MLSKQSRFYVQEDPPYERDYEPVGPDTIMYNILKARHKGDYKKADMFRKKLQEFSDEPLHISYGDNFIQAFVVFNSMTGKYQ